MDAWNLVYIAAVLLVVVGFVIWSATALKVVLWIGQDAARVALARRKFKAFLACGVFGAAYGAAFGAFGGPVEWLPAGQRPLYAVTWGAICGAGLGAFGGGVAGFVGNVVGGRVGWSLAGALGSATSAACLFVVDATAAAWEPVYHERILLLGTLVCSGAVLFGGFLGVALGFALRTGRSIVPGVQHLAAIINNVNAPEHAS